MNPLALVLLVVGTALLPGALLTGSRNGLAAAGVALVFAAIILQVAQPTTRKFAAVLRHVRSIRKAHHR